MLASPYGFGDAILADHSAFGLVRAQCDGRHLPVPVRLAGLGDHGGIIAAIAASVVLHGEAAWLTRIILCIGYIAFGVATYE